MKSFVLPTSNTPGVTFEKRRSKWIARVVINKESIHLGYFEVEEDAIKARNKGLQRKFEEEREEDAINFSMEKLRKLIFYDPKTGILRNKKTKKRFKLLGSKTSKENMYFNLQSRKLRVTSVILLIMANRRINPKKEITVHKDGNILNNKYDNIVIIKRKKYMKRSDILKSHNTSGVNGVYYSNSKEKWCAYINIDKKQTGLGTYNDKEEAIKSRREAEIKYGYKTKKEIINE